MKSAAALAADDATSGYCGAEDEGQNIFWKLTQSNSSDTKAEPTYTLTLTGSGAMADYGTQETPWYNYRQSITKIELPDGLTRIGKSAFLQTAVTQVTIPNTVTSIGQNAFWNCNTIETEVPASVTELGETAFYGTFEVTVAQDNPSYSAVGKIIYDKNQTKMIQVSQDIKGTLSIPETVEEIGAYTFNGCSKLSGELVIPDSVQVIGDAAFNGTGITSLELGKNVQEIGASAFQGCTSLAGTVTIPGSVQSIGDFAFAQKDNGNKNKISAIVLESGVKSIGDSAFAGCSSVTRLTLNEGLESIGEYAFNGLSRLSGDLNIPSTVETIGKSAFLGCTNLNGTLTIGGALTSVSADMVGSGGNGADGFTALVLRDGVESIDDGAFSNWTALTKVTIPDSVTEIGDSAFAHCEKLTDVSFGSGVKTIGDSAFTETALSGELELPDGLETIGTSAFSYCTSITEVNIPDSVRSIGYAAFAYNTKTQKVTVPYGDITYGMNEDGGAYVFSSYGENSALKTVVLGSTPNGVTASELFAESLDNVEQLVLGSGVTKIADWAFSSETVSLKGGLYPSTLNFDPDHTKLDDIATKFTLATEDTLQYGDTLQMMKFDKPEKGQDVSSHITYSSSNSEIATVDEKGMITATGASKTPVTISAQYDGCTFAELELTVEPRVLTYTLEDNVGSGSISYGYAEGHTDLDSVMTFQWKDDTGKTADLVAGEDINFTYTVNDDQATGGGEAHTYDYLPMPVGTYRNVKFNLLNENYTFALADGGTRDYLEITVNVAAEGQRRAYLADSAPKADQTFRYDGTGKMPVEGVLQAYAEDSTDSKTVDIGDFTVNIEGLNGTDFSSEKAGIKAGTDVADIEGLELPTLPGTYVITASAENDGYYLYKSLVFTIGKGEVTVTPDDKTVHVGDEMPELTYTVEGLAKGDELSGEVELSCDADMNVADEYTITASGSLSVDEELYEGVEYGTGTLTVLEKGAEPEPEPGDQDGSGTTDPAGDEKGDGSGNKATEGDLPATGDMGALAAVGSALAGAAALGAGIFRRRRK